MRARLANNVAVDCPSMIFLKTTEQLAFLRPMALGVALYGAASTISAAHADRLPADATFVTADDIGGHTWCRKPSPVSETQHRMLEFHKSRIMVARSSISLSSQRVISR
jgi:hypothetical protein